MGSAGEQVLSYSYRGMIAASLCSVAVQRRCAASLCDEFCCSRFFRLRIFSCFCVLFLLSLCGERRRAHSYLLTATYAGVRPAAELAAERRCAASCAAPLRRQLFTQRYTQLYAE